MSRTTSLAFLTLCVCALAGCGGGSGYTSSHQPPPAGGAPPPRPPAPQLTDWHGRYVGSATIGGEQRFVDAIFTVDGAVRLYVGGPGNFNGAVPRTKPADSAQFVGTFVERTSASASASGSLIGQGCIGTIARFCSETPQAQLHLTPVSSQLRGELRLSTAQGPETWQLQLEPWTDQYMPRATVELLTDQYSEEIADFASATAPCGLTSTARTTSTTLRSPSATARHRTCW